MANNNKTVFFLVAVASLLGSSVVVSTITMMGNNLAYSKEKMYCPPGEQVLCSEYKKFCESTIRPDEPEQKCHKVNL